MAAVACFPRVFRDPGFKTAKSQILGPGLLDVCFAFNFGVGVKGFCGVYVLCVYVYTDRYMCYIWIMFIRCGIYEVGRQGSGC